MERNWNYFSFLFLLSTNLLPPPSAVVVAFEILPYSFCSPEKTDIQYFYFRKKGRFFHSKDGLCFVSKSLSRNRLRPEKIFLRLFKFPRNCIFISNLEMLILIFDRATYEMRLHIRFSTYIISSKGLPLYAKHFTPTVRRILFLNGPFPASFSFILSPFQTNINTILQQINVKKCPSSIWHQDSNPRPSERESPPITTRPGLPPRSDEFLSRWYLQFFSVTV